MITRIAKQLVRKFSKEFRSLAIVGPRQSGKTTLARNAFPKKPYVSLENPDELSLVTSDPRAFLSRFRNGAIIDEVQRAPQIFQYLQQILDETSQEGLFVLTGSNNFLLQQSIAQSLAGRVGYIDLLPLSFSEIQLFNTDLRTTDQFILNGCYPEIFDKQRDHKLWFQAYTRTYVERDVRQIRNIENSILFMRFVQLCAGRIGQQLSLTALSTACGIDVKTVQAWLSILQSSYIIHLLPPHHANFNKRIVKTPKLYFVDTGLASSLLGIRTESEMFNSHFKGALFENYVVMELLKWKLNTGSATNLYYWRDNKGLEVDIILDTGQTLFPVEIKASQTFQSAHVHSLEKWNAISGNTHGALLYDGPQEFVGSSGIHVLNWRHVQKLKAYF